MKNRIAAVLMSICVAASMCACGSETAQPAQTVQEDAADEAESGTETTQEQSVSPTDAGEAATQMQAAEEQLSSDEEEVQTPSEETLSDVRPDVLFLYYNRMEEKDTTTIARCSFGTPQLIEEAAIAYPQLNKTLVTDSDTITKQYEQYYEEIEEAAESAFETMDGDTEEFPTGEVEGRMEVARCDASVLSFYDTISTFYPGAAHGMVGFNGYNYDTASGEPIALEDVFADMKAMEAAIADNLISTATSDKIPKEDAMLEFAFENGYGDLDWVIERDGVRFLFAPSDIAPYALGAIEARISFEENPSLFTGKYGKATGGYVQKLNPYELYTVDLDGDGSVETLSVSGSEEESDGGYYYTGLEVHVGEDVHVKEDTFYSLTAYLFHTEDGRNYVYAITSGDNDYNNLTVFEIKDNLISTVGEMGGTGTAYFYVNENFEGEEFDLEKTHIEQFMLTDPARFALSTSMALMSSYSGVRYYEVGSDGMPAPLSNQYEIRSGIELTSRVPLKAEEVDEISGEGTGKEVEIPAGTKCTFYQTNGIDTVDLRTEEDTIVRFHVEEGAPQMVNGVELEEAFDGTGFGG